MLPSMMVLASVRTADIVLGGDGLGGVGVVSSGGFDNVHGDIPCSATKISTTAAITTTRTVRTTAPPHTTPYAADG
jgi:hypothetical protein